MHVKVHQQRKQGVEARVTFLTVALLSKALPASTAQAPTPTGGVCPELLQHSLSLRIPERSWAGARSQERSHPLLYL